MTQATNKLTLDKLAKTGLDEGWLFKSEADAIAANSMDP